jgi:hypothetical protein
MDHATLEAQLETHVAAEVAALVGLEDLESHMLEAMNLVLILRMVAAINPARLKEAITTRMLIPILTLKITVLLRMVEEYVFSCLKNYN